MEERVIKRLMASVKCSSCGRNHTERNVHIIGRHHKLWFIHAYCASCQTEYLLAETVTSEQAEIISDLTETELARFKNTRAPTADDILDMHSFLKNFEGDFTRLFGRERVG